MRLSISSSRRLPRVAALAALACALLIPLLGFAQAPAKPEPGAIYRLKVRSAIHPVSAELIEDAVKAADGAGAAALVVELDTPGGLVTSTRAITTAMLGARTPVVVYVGPSGAQAASAGFFILMAADVAAMAPGTNTGAAHPVGGQGETIDGVLGKKVEEDAAANIRSLAARNGRNVELAQAAVVDSRSYTAQEALDGKLIDLVAADFPALLLALDGRQVKRGDAVVGLRTRGAAVYEVETSSFRRFLGVLADPNIAYILLTFGMLGLYFELMNPGAILPGVVGGICLILGFFALSVLPFSYAGLALLALAVLLFIAEIKITSYGMLSVAGVICLVLGSLMLFKTAEPALRVSLELIAALAAFSLAVVGFLLWMSMRARRTPVTTGAEGLLREVGTARSALAPGGKVFVHGEIWNAVAEEPVAAGEPVEVVAVRNLTLTVRPYRQGASG
ncbi:MAG TPA: nodulation protein NfeD [Thermoanaerobaculia bacterium]|nr:nodulation protein NfeD [Thermoanaerobaculia bacterium]